MIPQSVIKHMVILEITSFIGTSPGAIHYYGKLIDEHNDKRADVAKELTTAEARHLNEGDFSKAWKKGHLSERIETKDKVRTAAKMIWRKEFPDSKVLVEGSWTTNDPKIIIDTTFPAGTKSFVLNALANAHYEYWYRLDELREDYWKVLDNLHEAWEKLFVEWMEENCG